MKQNYLGGQKLGLGARRSQTVVGERTSGESVSNETPVADAPGA